MQALRGQNSAAAASLDARVRGAKQAHARLSGRSEDVVSSSSAAAPGPLPATSSIAWGSSGGIASTAGGRVPSGTQTHAQAQRTALLGASATLEGTTARLQDAHRTALAAEQAGADVLAALGAQRQQMQRIRDQQEEVRQEVDGSTAILNRMGRWYNRMLGV